MKHSKSNLFLMELIISILFFALSSAVCIQLFVKAHLLGRETANQNQYVLWTQNLAELWLACEGNLTEIAGLLSEMPEDSLSLSGEYLQVTLNKNWEPCSGDKAAYSVIVNSSGFDKDQRLNLGQVTISGKHDILYTLVLKQHPAERRANIHD